MKLLTVFLVFVTFYSGDGRRTAEEWRTRKIYQILTDRFAGEDAENWEECVDLTGYCNGNFRGLIQYLDYITGMGFNAIWISPVPEHVEGDYHGYSATNFYSVSHHWGTEQDFFDLMAEAHARDVWIMIDAVPNHMGIDVYGEIPTEWYPFNETEHYHPFCNLTDFDDQEQLENCWLFGLPDLNQENDFVTEELCNWIDWYLTRYDIDGMRIDTVRHIPMFFWERWAECIGDVYEVGEVYAREVDYVFDWVPPLDAVLNFPLYYEMMDTFAYGEGTMRNIASKYDEVKALLSDNLHIQGTFVDNHDRARFLCESNSFAGLRNYIVLGLTMEGIPILYYGTEQAYDGCGDPLNRESLFPNFNTDHELYQLVATTNYYTRGMGDDFLYSDQVERFLDDNLYAFTRGQTLVISTNVGDFGDITRTIGSLDYEVGTVLVNIFSPGTDRITVEEDGITVTHINGEAKVYIPEDIYETIS